MNAVKNTAARVIDCQFASHLHPILEPWMNYAQIDCVAETILAAVNHAAAPGLDR